MLEDIISAKVRDYIGNLVFQVMALQAQLVMANEEIQRLKALAASSIMAEANDRGN